MKRQRVINRLAPAFAWLWAADHDLGGFDEGYCGVAGFEGEFAHSVGGDDSGDALVADGEDDFGKQAVDDDLNYGAEELVAATDSSRAGMGLGRRDGAGEELVERFEGNAVVAAGGFDGTDAAGEDPVLE